jgi:hypothetical protein
VEVHTALFHLLIKDEGDYFTVLQNKKRKLKVNYSSYYYSNLKSQQSGTIFCSTHVHMNVLYVGVFTYLEGISM